jgi:hypothetical protein
VSRDIGYQRDIRRHYYLFLRHERIDRLINYRIIKEDIEELAKSLTLSSENYCQLREI